MIPPPPRETADNLFPRQRRAGRNGLLSYSKYASWLSIPIAWSRDRRRFTLGCKYLSPESKHAHS